VEVRKGSAVTYGCAGREEVTRQCNCGKVVLCPSLDFTHERSAAKAETLGAFNRGAARTSIWKDGLEQHR